MRRRRTDHGETGDGETYALRIVSCTEGAQPVIPSESCAASDGRRTCPSIHTIPLNDDDDRTRSGAEQFESRVGRMPLRFKSRMKLC
jgi:hypothetical protein